MATDAQLEALFKRTALAATNATGETQSQTNVPDVRNIASTAMGQVVEPLQAARRADVESLRREGVPLNTELGAPPGTRFRLAFTSDLPSQIKLLQAKYGVENIAVSPQGQLVIRNLMDEKTGKVQDVVVDEERMSAKDLIDLSGAIPEVIGAAAAMRGVRGIPKVGTAGGKTGFVRDVLAGSIGAQAGAELSQRALGESAMTLSEALESRAKGAAVDVGFNLLTAGTAKAVPFIATKLRAPLAGSQTVVQKEAVAAAERLAQQTGERVKFTIGEETGSPIVMKSEAMLEKVPGGTTTIRAQKAAQEESLRNIQQHMLGNGPMPTQSSVGLDAIDRLKQIGGALDESTAAARQQVADTASAEILASFDSLSTPSRQMFQRPVGEAIRTRAKADLDAFKAQSRALYDDVYSTPGANDPIIPTAPLKKMAKEIEAALPKKTEVVEEVSEFVDAQGRPIVKTTTGKEVLREFVPPQLRKFIGELASGLDPKMPLNEVVQMRQIVNDAIEQSDVLPGIGTRFLKQVSHALTDAIDQGVKAAPDPTLAAKLSKANEFYKTGRPRFEKAGIVELFREADQPGHIGNAQIVRRISQGDLHADRYFDMRDFLGADSSEFRMLKRSVLDDIYTTSHTTEGFLDAKKFVDQIKGLDREVAQDLLGTKGEEAIRAARMLGSVQGKIDVKELDQLLSSGTATADAVRELIQKQQKLDSFYANNVIKKFVKGEAGAETIAPDEFVGRYLDVAKSPGEIQQVMALLQDKPDVTKAIRRKTLEKFFADAARSPDPIDLTKNVMGDPTRAVSGKSMVKALGNEQDQAKLRAVLGDETMGMIKDLVRVEAALGVKEQAAQTVGGLVGGGIVSRLLRLDFKDALAIAKYKLVAATLANPQLRTFLAQQVSPPDTAGLARALIASGPLIQDLAEEFGNESGALAMLDNLKTALERSVGTGQAQAVEGQQKVSDTDLENLFKKPAPKE